MPEVTVTLQQPAALGRRPSGGTLIDTFRHVPGSVLRGALATAWIRRHGLPERADPHLREEFVACFERGVRFGPLLAPGWGVLPLSKIRCKYRPEPDCHLHIADADTPAPRCPLCGGPMVPGSGEVEPLTAAARAAGPATVTATRVRLTPEETAVPGMLFTRAALAHQDGNGRARVLSGRIIGAPELNGVHHIQLGGRRSTAGQATCHIRPDNPDPDRNPDTAGGAGIPHLLDGNRLVLTLASPAILVDAFGRAAAVPDPGVLRELLGVPVPKPQNTWIRRELVGGWHAASRLPKPDEWAVAAGSVFEYRLPADPGPQALARLADHGLGLRRPEGFGWITIGAWTPPTAPAPEPQARPADRPQILEQALAGFIDRGLLTHLRDRAAALARDHTAAADRSLLNLPKVRELPPQRRRAFEHALDLDAAQLAELCRRLDANLRGTR